MEKNHHKISIDGGALINEETRRFGNYTFSQELISALARYDKVNEYRLYLQEAYPAFGKQILTQVITPKRGWLKLGVGLKELISPKDLFLALNQALPFHTPAKVIAFSHGAAPLFFPKLYPDSHRKLKKQTQAILTNAKFVIVGSRKVKQEMISQFKLKTELAEKLIVIPYGIGQRFLEARPLYKRKSLLLFVGSNHPIKNLPFLLGCFRELVKDSRFSSYKLALVGITSQDLSQPDRENSQTIPLGHLPYKQLIKYYQEASCLISGSHYESFNLPVLEALSQRTPVVATESAIIPELRLFVSIAPAQTHAFVKALKKALRQPREIDLAKLKANFSWERYVNKLTKLYAK